MKGKAVITGGAGLIGKALAHFLKNEGYKVIVLTRNIPEDKIENIEYIIWNYREPGEWIKSLEGSEAVINLAGKNLASGRWNSETRKAIRESRVNLTQNLVEYFESLTVKPSYFISASAVGYYGNPPNPVDENSPRGNGFLAELTAEWEKSALAAEQLGVRTACLRFGAVLSTEGGALPKIIKPIKYFAGAVPGSGKQYFPWIHIDDAVRMIDFLIQKKSEGIFNAVSPHTIRIEDLIKTAGEILRRPVIFRIPEFLIRALLGEASEIILNGAAVKPARIISEGYDFEYSDIRQALENLLK
ncbi:NAD-dependent epimerase/dehydratase family protein [Melioribacter roseus P3M-2]|uniref:NAD-dependent epimerase/dehydratase family protein n=1 Tax=Melioribacter roseus (strain DSM 23840 / JCM 17771 / VKM B-2668 / P3M-2) TaxID=1191523 RepID=I7A1X9_MELRP|nr:TIGR01777 family oxidoreductase [Melioribacter roseus]AFN73911.1 NAD-dependent epimerase/dehydratase family protein [Melioribacter roseus P3M-2]